MQQPHEKLARHRTSTRRRKGVWLANCSCGWSSESAFAFSAWSESRRHLTDMGALQPPPPPPNRLRVGQL
jgi:hypothetical protein